MIPLSVVDNVYLVVPVGLEPTRLSTSEPKTDADANFATRPLLDYISPLSLA